LLFAYVNPFAQLRNRDVELIGITIAAVIAMLNLIVIESNKGAFLTAVNLLLVIYLSDKVSFSEKEKMILSGCGAAFLGIWFCDVKWDYNFNMVGLVFMVIGILSLLFLEILREKFELGYLIYVEIMLYVTITLYTILYHSRCAMVGLLLFGLFVIAGKKIGTSKVFFRCLTLLATVGSILFTVLYVYLGSISFNLKFLYKDLLSGREDIWRDLWEVFLKSPVTGIGSSYKMRNFFIFEVHNGLFDILVVHGILVFIVALLFLLKRLFQFQTRFVNTNQMCITMAGFFAMLFTSFFENYFIVSPYLMVFFVLLTWGNEERNF
jgi:O-antigen ligase